MSIDEKTDTCHYLDDDNEKFNEEIRQYKTAFEKLSR